MFPSMTVLERLRYALYLYIALGMIVMLALSVAGADAVALIPNIDVGRVMSNPLYIVPVYAICFLAAPKVYEHFPIKRDNGLP